MLQAVKVNPLPGYRLLIEYNDGVSGEMDLSQKLDHDYYKEWKREGVFEKARITSYGTAAWGDDLEFCSDALYMEITGKSWEELLDYVKLVSAGLAVRDA